MRLLVVPRLTAKCKRSLKAVKKQHFTVLERFDAFTLVELQLETGRTHQIRVHMKYIGYPLAGDPLYGPKTLPGNGQFYMRSY